MLFAVALSQILDYTVDFKQKIPKNEYTVVKFYSPNCKACQKMKDTFDAFEDVAAKHGVKLAQVDCIEAVDFCREDGIQGWPTIRFYHNGKFMDKYRNVHVLEAYEDWLETMLERYP